MTKECIESIKSKTSGISYEIILVDNASTDGSGEYFPYRKDIKYIYNHENIGFGRASNLGVSNSNGKYIFLLNSDTLLLNNAIKILFDYLEHSDDTAVVGGNLYKFDETPTLSFERLFPGIRYTLNLLSKNILNRLSYGRNRVFNYSDKPLSVAYISGADLMVEREIYNRFHGLSEDYFMYYEETDLCYRIKNSNYKIYNIPSAKIIHLEGGSQKTKESIIKKLNIQLQSRNIFMKRNHKKLYCFFDRILFSLYLKLRNLNLR